MVWNTPCLLLLLIWKLEWGLVCLRGGEIEVVIDLFISCIALFSAGLSRTIGESITRAIFMREYMQ